MSTPVRDSQLTQDEEEQQVEADTEIDNGDTGRQSGTEVVDSGKGSNFYYRNWRMKKKKVEEVNGDASSVCGKVKKKKMQVKKNILGREKRQELFKIYLQWFIAFSFTFH
ncbi:BnaC01g21380D [Brassica napus]|uniref:BnaC01g21380D protein n=1 Tax=Brassica napus TaxID=3708 RepID=A0A078HD29_BRANA|nr:BnaC01g21380D [Brassica napus]